MLRGAAAAASTVGAVQVLVWGFFDREIHTAALLLVAAGVWLLPGRPPPAGDTGGASLWGELMPRRAALTVRCCLQCMQVLIGQRKGVDEVNVPPRLVVPLGDMNRPDAAKHVSIQARITSILRNCGGESVVRGGDVAFSPCGLKRWS